MQIHNIGKTPKEDRKTKIISGISTILGTTLALSVISKRHRYSKKILLDSYNGKEIFGLALGSVCGGLIGGTISDPMNSKAKLREGLTQLFGNTLIPLILVTTSLSACKKIYPKEKNIAMVGVGALALGVGIFLGNKVSNLINTKIFHKEEHREIRPTDFAPHVDDTCVGLSIILNNSTIGNKISKVVPFALMVGGYITGIAKEN
jgi:hypothetical protein